MKSIYAPKPESLGNLLLNYRILTSMENGGHHHRVAYKNGLDENNVVDDVKTLKIIYKRAHFNIHVIGAGGTGGCPGAAGG